MKHILEVSKTADPSSFVGQVVSIPTRRVQQLPGQPRTHFDPVQMKRLQDSIAEIGQQQPATVVPWNDGTFRLRDGERRWRSCVTLKIPVIALVVEAKTPEEEFELSAAANMNRESHSPLEKALAMKRLRDGPLKRTINEIARTFGVTDTTVSSHLLVVDSLPEAIVNLMDPNQQGGRKRTLQVSAAVKLTALKDYPREQLRIALRIVRDNLPLSQAFRAIDQFADTKKITEGRGRERKPSDHLRLLNSALRTLQPQLDHFQNKDQAAITELFAFLPAWRPGEVVAQIDKAICALNELRAKVSAAKIRRSA